MTNGYSSHRLPASLLVAHFLVVLLNYSNSNFGMYHKSLGSPYLSGLRGCYDVIEHHRFLWHFCDFGVEFGVFFGV